jgi:hypothetical protein
MIKSRRMRWAGYTARMGEKKSYKLGNPAGKIMLGKPTYMWVDNIRIDLGEMGRGDVDWIGLAQDRDRWSPLVNWVMNLRVL